MEIDVEQSHIQWMDAQEGGGGGGSPQRGGGYPRRGGTPLNGFSRGAFSSGVRRVGAKVSGVEEKFGGGGKNWKSLDFHENEEKTTPQCIRTFFSKWKVHKNVNLKKRVTNDKLHTICWISERVKNYKK